jgi:hypothetical protein
MHTNPAILNTFMPMPSANLVLNLGASRAKTTFDETEAPQLPTAINVPSPTVRLYPLSKLIAIHTTVTGIVIYTQNVMKNIPV